MSCNKCKNILGKDSSMIGNPLCNSDCPQDVVCTEIYPAKCTFYSAQNLSCSGINFGDSIDTAFQKVDALLCSQSQDCYTWTALNKGNLGLASGWAAAGSGYQNPAISNVKNCIVRLAGVIKKNAIVGSTYDIVGVLPVGKRPNAIRLFNVNLNTSLAYPLNMIATQLIISTDGTMALANPYTGILSNVVLSLDGISFETGTLV